jgi:hypothetical protein
LWLTILPPTSRENFFQSLENGREIFPIIGKIAPFFPTIGQFFSNHWKTGLLAMSYQIVRNPVAVGPVFVAKDNLSVTRARART